MPSLHFGLEDTIVGPVGLMGIRTVAAADWATSGTTQYSAAATGGTFADAAFTVPIRQEYIAAWGATTSHPGFSASTPFHSKGGFRVNVATGINWHQGPVLGTFMGTFVNASVTVECEPAEPSAVLALAQLSSQIAAGKRGAVDAGATLTITGESNGATNSAIVFTLPKAKLVGGKFGFGSGSSFLRVGTFGFVAQRAMTTPGTMDALFTLTLS
jgi:hypothetical protein